MYKINDYSNWIVVNYIINAKMTIFCTFCNAQHIDDGSYALKPHKQHLCFHCGKKFFISKASIGVLKGKNKTL